jgi:hypothetical protein
MLRLAIIDSEGKIVAPKDVPTAAELVALAEQARNVIRECERLAQQAKAKNTGASAGNVPYLS